jgi:hypothetical protein
MFTCSNKTLALERKMLNRSEILRSAWASYRKTASLIGLATFSRKRFASALRMAWDDAKVSAFYAALEAEEAAEAQANPAKAEARSELLDIQMKDRWTAADHDRVSFLTHAIAA